MKLIQLNAWGGRLDRQIEDYLTKELPDILCLQESISFSKLGAGLFITVEQLQRHLNLPRMAFAPAFSFNYMNGIARFGNAILSNLVINKYEAVYTNLEHQNNFVYGVHSNNVRNFVHAVMQVGDKQLNVITHHGYWIPEHKNGTAEIQKQIKIIADYIKELEGPVILTGDFNLIPNSESLKQLNEMLNNLSITYKLKTTRTSLTYKTEVCDYIFVSNDIKVKDFHASDSLISDHKALILDFDL